MASFVLFVFVIAVAGGTFWYLAKQAPAKGDKPDLSALASLSGIEGFTPAIVYEGFPGSHGLAIDPASNKFAIAIPGSSARVYHYSQLMAAEVDRGGTTITTTKGKISTGGAAVATALVGPVGGLMMGAETSSTSTTDESVMLALKVYVDDMYTPCYTIPFGGGFKDEFGTDGMLKAAVEKVDAWFGRFKSILIGLEGNRPVGINPDAILYTTPAPAPAKVGWADRVFGA